MFYQRGNKEKKIEYIEKNYRKLSNIEKDKILKEDCVLMPYRCSEGILTDGVGNTQGVIEGKVITLEKAIANLEEDISIAEKELLKIFTLEELIRVGVVRYNVLVDLVFNMGLPTLKTFKNFIKYTKEQKYMLASLNLLYVNPQQLTDRTSYWKQVGDRALNNAEIFVKGY